MTLDRLKFRATLNAAGPNAVITLDVDGTDYLTIVKNMQPSIANRVTHVDFMLIDIDQLDSRCAISLVGDAVVKFAKRGRRSTANDDPDRRSARRQYPTTV